MRREDKKMGTDTHNHIHIYEECCSRNTWADSRDDLCDRGSPCGHL